MLIGEERGRTEDGLPAAQHHPSARSGGLAQSAGSFAGSCCQF
jgi:hypothetical protein